jgi:hypothetical protein
MSSEAPGGREQGHSDEQRRGKRSGGGGGGRGERDDGFCDRTTAPVPKWEELAGNRAVWVQLCQLPATAAGSGEFGLELEGTGRVLVDQVQ